MADGIEIRTLARAQIDQAVGWAAAEGWNPGLHDADCFTTVDPEGFIGGFLGEEMVSSISVMNYDEAFAFLGFYIVRPQERGRGYGLATWRAGIAHAGTRVIGLDGVPAQQVNYRRSGFDLAYRNVRHGGTVPSLAADPPEGCTVLPASAVPFDSLAAYDRSAFPVPRTAFLQAWLTAPGHLARVLTRGTAICGMAVARPCKEGVKVGPLFADDEACAGALFAAVMEGLRPDTKVFLDVPEPNSAAAGLARSLGLAPVFETARMYRGVPPPVDPARVFGVTSFELG